MQTTQLHQRSRDDSERTGSDSLALAAGAAVAVGGAGAALALSEADSALRAPFTLFFLLGAPAAALAMALRRLDPLSRTVIAVIGAMAVDLLVAEVMIAAHIWSARGGVVAVGVLSLALLLATLAPALSSESRKRQDR
ncbi:hypothetical protein [Streptomyces iconiensis]|uniref:Integral membrane protein n=1 Tax=Streptomyces iconiensis TaxID=1384038 RepID=A0ABT7A975_9ACTN|nr:hypothetical protein [Streptomyces iconiensis]MDJ1137880.1 hypothetical protein [Streptomyces iconiensis]